MTNSAKKIMSLVALSSSAALLIIAFQNCAPGFAPKVGGTTKSSSLQSNVGAKSENPFTCATPDQQAATPMKRLTKTQYANTLRKLVGAEIQSKVSTSIDLLYADELKKSVSDFSNSVTDAQLTAYQRIAEAVQAEIKANPSAAVVIAGSCLQSATVTAVCQDEVIGKIGRQAFRRPLEAAELTRWKQVYALGEDKTAAVALVVYGMLMSPNFLLHVEIGAGSAETGPSFTLSPFEVASKLSYGIADSPPDDLLFQAAAKGELRTIDQVKPHVERLMSTPEAKAKVRLFVSYWVDPKRYSASNFAPEFLQGLNVNEANVEFERELFEYAEYIIFEKKGTFDDLISSRESFARTPAAASIYGHAPVQGPRPALTDGSRKGLFMRAPLLAGDGNETHPILRGVKFRNRFLCQTVGLPVGVMTNDPTFFSDKARAQMSTRERTQGITSGTSCMGCHASINPVGFAFENFDNFGRVRQKERAFSTSGTLLAEHAIDTSSQGIQLGAQTVSIRDGLDVIDNLMQENQLPGCFVRQVTRFYRLQEESMADACLLNKMYDQVFIQPNTPVLEVFKSQFLQPSLFTRRL